MNFGFFWKNRFNRVIVCISRDSAVLNISKLIHLIESAKSHLTGKIVYGVVSNGLMGRIILDLVETDKAFLGSRNYCAEIEH